MAFPNNYPQAIPQTFPQMQQAQMPQFFEPVLVHWTFTEVLGLFGRLQVGYKNG